MNIPVAKPRTEAAAVAPVAETPNSLTRGRPSAEAWIAAARLNRARWRLLNAARPAPELWKMPTTKTRSPFFRQSPISTLIEYDSEIIDAIVMTG